MCGLLCTCAYGLSESISGYVGLADGCVLLTTSCCCDVFVLEDVFDVVGNVLGLACSGEKVSRVL